MKGSVGVSGGIRSAGVSVGSRGASGGRIGPSRSIGGSLSPEARFGGPASKFSSRGLSGFNRSPISFKEIGGKKSSNSIVNINRGLNRPRSMFDMSRPVRLHPTSQPSEFGVRVSLKNGREVKSSKARSQNLTSPRPIFDFSRKPTSEFGKRISLKTTETPLRSVNMPFGRETRRTVAQRTIEVGFNPRVRSERVKSINPFKDTVVLWQRSDVSPRVKLEAMKQVRLVEGLRQVKKERTQRVKRRSAEINSILKKSEVNPIRKIKSESLPKRKIEKSKVPTRIRVGNRIRISHDTSPDVRNLIHADIKEAQNAAIPKIMRARGVSYEKALEEVVELLVQRHKDKVRLVSLKPQAKAQTLPEVKPQVAKTTEYQVESQKMPTEEMPSKEKKPKSASVVEKLLFFKKDVAANERRRNRFEDAYQRLLKYKKEGEEITSLDVVKEAGNPNSSEMSEITRPLGVDYQYGNFLYATRLVASIFTNPRDFLSFLHITIRLHSAIKLSTKKDADAKGQDAMQVYGKTLDHVEAYVGDLESTGQLVAGAESQKVRIVKKKEQEVLYQDTKNTQAY